MKTKNIRLAALLIVINLFLISCGLLAPTPETSADALFTQAAQTIQAELTQQALSTPVFQPTQAPPTPTQVGAPTNTQPAPVTSAPTATLPPSPTPTILLPTPTSLPPSPTPIPVLCNHARFVKDVTVADGTVYAPGSEFTKVWRLENVGSCTWDEDYSLIFVSGDRMDAPRSVGLSETVRPGERVDVSVDFIAPAGRDTYRGYWMLESDDGEDFGIGSSANKAFWVEIRVQSPNQNFAYDFATNMCTATWRSSAGSLSCPGDPDDEDGSVSLLDKPVLENGRHENEPTLWTRPEATREGWIQGVFPEYKVREGDHFLAEIGCLEDYDRCEVLFSVDYQVSGGSVKNLGEWYEVYDEAITRVDIDLSDLEGRTVQFILRVTNYGRPSHANPFWLVPSIRRDASTPPPVVYAPAIEAARQRVAQDTGIKASDITVQSFMLTEWKDTCLGVHLPDQICAEAIIPGYKVNMTANRKYYEAHTNMDGSIVYWFEL